MDRVSSISNSKPLRYAGSLIVLFLSVVSSDRILYSLLFNQYDKMFSMAKNFKPADVLIVGSSHILWDLDPAELGAGIDKRVHLLNVPGADLVLRKEMISEFVRVNRNELPALIVLETDKLVFHRGRYSDSAYKSVKGYYHKGWFVDFLDRKIRAEESTAEYAVFRGSHAYSLNSFSHFVFSKLYDKYLSSAFRWSLGAIEPPKDERVEVWKKQYETFTPEADPALISELHEILKLTKLHGIRTILLETPNYRFSAEADAEFAPIRSRLAEIAKTYSAAHIRLKPEYFETKPDLFFDASHLNPIGKTEYTNEFKNTLRSSKMF